jgi:MoxR-like ATPase
MMVEEFGAITNREVVRIQCSKMDPSDLFFSPQLKAGETSRQPAEWIKIMQKPGVLILFDEIDKLDPQCFERLHRLFDSGRSIYDPQIGTIKAHPDCIFAGTRNSYEVLSNPIVSRSSIIQINAPSEENEAFKVAKYTGIDYFKNISFDEFKDLYAGNPSDTIKFA